MTDHLVVAARRAWEPLAELFADVLGLAAVGPDDDFFTVGGDSVVALTAVARARRSGVELGLEELYRGRTPRRIARSSITRRAAVAPEPASGRNSPLLPAQDRAVRQWRVLTRWPVLSFVLECAHPIDLVALEAALNAVIAHHEGLRLRIQRDGPSDRDWRLRVARAEDHQVVEVADVLLSARTLPSAIQDVAERLHVGIDPTGGPMLRVAAVGADGAAPRHIVVVLHHFCADQHSVSIVKEDLESAYQQIVSGAAVTLPSATGSILEFAARCAAYATGPSGAVEARFWEAEAERLRTRSAGRKRLPGRRYERLNLEVEREQAAALRQGTSHGRGLFEPVAGALVHSLRDTAHDGLTSFAYLHHGRGPRFPGLDLSRTVGWPMAEVPVLVDTSAVWTVPDAVAALRREVARPPGGGLGFLSMCGWAEGTSAEAVKTVYDSVEVVLNVAVGSAGESGEAFRFADSHPDLEKGQPGYSCALSLVCTDTNSGGVNLCWSFDPAAVPRATVMDIADRHFKALLALASVSPERLP